MRVLTKSHKQRCDKERHHSDSRVPLRPGIVDRHALEAPFLAVAHQLAIIAVIKSAFSDRRPRDPQLPKTAFSSSHAPLIACDVANCMSNVIAIGAERMA
jgi:hypothetical protein